MRDRDPVAVQAKGGANQRPTMEYKSVTLGCWIKARVVAEDQTRNAVQLDVKPGLWLSLKDPRLRPPGAKAPDAGAGVGESEAQVQRSASAQGPAQRPPMVVAGMDGMRRSWRTDTVSVLGIDSPKSSTSRRLRDATDFSQRGGGGSCLLGSAGPNAAAAPAPSVTLGFSPSIQGRLVQDGDAVPMPRVASRSLSREPARTGKALPISTVSATQRMGQPGRGNSATTYRCPKCDADGLPSFSAAVNHCTYEVGGEGASPVSAGRPDANATPKPSLGRMIETAPIDKESSPQHAGKARSAAYSTASAATQPAAPPVFAAIASSSSSFVLSSAPGTTPAAGATNPAGAGGNNGTAKGISNTSANTSSADAAGGGGGGTAVSAARMPQRAPGALSPGTPGGNESRAMVLGYNCPMCGTTGLATLSEAASHCGRGREQESSPVGLASATGIARPGSPGSALGGLLVTRAAISSESAKMTPKAKATNRCRDESSPLKGCGCSPSSLGGSSFAGTPTPVQATVLPSGLASLGASGDLEGHKSFGSPRAHRPSASLAQLPSSRIIKGSRVVNSSARSTSPPSPTRGFSSPSVPQIGATVAAAKVIAASPAVATSPTGETAAPVPPPLAGAVPAAARRPVKEERRAPCASGQPETADRSTPGERPASCTRSSASELHANPQEARSTSATTPAEADTLKPSRPPEADRNVIDGLAAAIDAAAVTASAAVAAAAGGRRFSHPHAGQPVPPGTLTPGARVVLGGLEGLCLTQELNGARGVLVGRANDPDFWVVDLEGGMGSKALNAKYISLVDAVTPAKPARPAQPARAPAPSASTNAASPAGARSPLQSAATAVPPQPTSAPAARSPLQQPAATAAPPQPASAPAAAEPSRPKRDGELPAVRELQEALRNAEVIARDSEGRPTIARKIDISNGNAKTIVVGDEGTQQAFGETTVKSLLDAPEAHARKWLDTLSTHQMRGLIHEVGQRLVDQSQVYHARVKELKRLSDLNGFAYFGLSNNATAKELEAAYRTLAKKMHPDKNGGTEEAKQLFQGMKEKYEKLKKALEEQDAGAQAERDEMPAASGGGGGDAGGGVAGCILDGEKPPEDQAKSSRRKEAYDEDEDDERRGKGKEKKEEKREALEYDPFDRGSIEKCMWQMLEQLKHIRPQQEKIVRELYEAMSQLQECP